ncbi:hypothetical protein LCGC14_1899740, partial [marine sediment metagenome]
EAEGGRETNNKRRNRMIRITIDTGRDGKPIVCVSSEEYEGPIMMAKAYNDTMNALYAKGKAPEKNQSGD